MDKVNLRDVETFRLDINGAPDLKIKSGIVWGQIGSTMFPVIYLRRPGHIPDEEFRELLKAMSICINMDDIKKIGKK